MTLKEHTVKSYDQDLQSIAHTINEMVTLVCQSIDMVYDMIKSRDKSFIERITAHDYKINSLDSLVEKKVTAILALRQPLAVDLRYVASSLKVASNLERSGDKAKSIIKKLTHIGKEELDKNVEESLFTMIELSKAMTIQSVKAFNDQDVELAGKILQEDDKIDQIYEDLFALIDGNQFSKEEVKRIMNTLFIAKSFERLADHATNIAEVSEYVVTGENKDAN